MAPPWALAPCPVTVATSPGCQNHSLATTSPRHSLECPRHPACLLHSCRHNLRCWWHSLSLPWPALAWVRHTASCLPGNARRSIRHSLWMFIFLRVNQGILRVPCHSSSPSSSPSSLSYVPSALLLYPKRCSPTFPIVYYIFFCILFSCASHNASRMKSRLKFTRPFLSPAPPRGPAKREGHLGCCGRAAGSEGGGAAPTPDLLSVRRGAELRVIVRR